MRRTIRLVMLLLAVSAVSAVGVIVGRSIAPPAPPITRAEVEADVGLDRVVADVNFKQMPLAEAVDFLREKTAANLVVKWRVLETTGIGQNTPITLRLTNLPLKRVLELMCDSAGGGSAELDARALDGAIVLSTVDDHSRYVAVRLYDIRDLMQAHYDYRVRLGWKPPPPPPPPATGPANSLFSASAAKTQPDPHAEAIDEIIHLITEQVAPAAWRDAGGTIGTIRHFNGRLMITATPAMHDEIVALLALLRKEK